MSAEDLENYETDMELGPSVHHRRSWRITGNLTEGGLQP